MNIENVVEDLYKDIVEKRNKCKIDLDNYVTEIEIAKRSIEYKSSMEDDSRFFSPRNNDNGIESRDELNYKLEEFEKMADDKNNEFEYYDSYCKRLSEYLNQNNKKEKLSNDIDHDRNNDNDISYSINLNYNVDDIKTKLSIIKNMVDLCVNIFENDRERTKQELSKIKKSVDRMIDEL